MEHDSNYQWVGSPLSELHPMVLCGGVMIRLDLSWFYRLGTAANALRQIRYDVPVSEVAYAFGSIRPWLSQLWTDPTISPALRSSKGPLRLLIDRVDTLWSRPSETILSFTDVMDLMNDLNRFENVLISELSILDSYYVLEKKPYSTLTLVSEGERLFPPGLPRKVPEAVGDLAEAGKCLAFEVPTAAAFHIHRATEAVLRRYWTAVSGAAPKPKARNIGVYLAAMKKLGCGDDKVIAALTQLKDLHRNPVFHPEESLDMEEAIALVGISNSVVAAMLKEIPDVESTQPEIAFPPLIEGGQNYGANKDA